MSRFEHVREITPQHEGRELRIGIVLGRFNAEIGDNLLNGCVTELLSRGVDPEHLLIVTVPGALEMPLTLQTMAQTGRYDALIALGAVIRGDTYHFEIVSNEMASGITQVQLETGLPIANGVLTTEDDDQAVARMHVKGQECAGVAIEMAHLLKTLKNVR